MKKKYEVCHGPLCKKERKPEEKKEKLGMTEKEVKKYINDRVWKHFCEWMHGQTCPVLENGEPGIFKHDVERYVEGILHGRPTYWD